jgi:hypothetical protein
MILGKHFCELVNLSNLRVPLAEHGTQGALFLSAPLDNRSPMFKLSFMLAGINPAAT